MSLMRFAREISDAVATGRAEGALTPHDSPRPHRSAYGQSYSQWMGTPHKQRSTRGDRHASRVRTF